MAFNDLQGKVISESAIQAAHKNMAKLSLFAKSYSPTSATAYSTVVVPVYDFTDAAEFAAGSNDYGTGTNELDSQVITLNQHLCKSVSITDRQLAETGIAWVKETAGALADSVTRTINANVFGMINSTNVTAGQKFDATTKTTVADLYKLASDNDIPVDRAVVALAPAQFAKVLALLDSSAYGGTEAIRDGVIPGLYGFKGFVCTSNLPSTENGAIILDGAIGIGNRYLAPGIAGAYPEAYEATDEDGFTIGFRRFMNLNTGADMFACDCLYGAKIVQAKKIVRLTVA